MSLLVFTRNFRFDFPVGRQCTFKGIRIQLLCVSRGICEAWKAPRTVHPARLASRDKLLLEARLYARAGQSFRQRTFVRGAVARSGSVEKQAGPEDLRGGGRGNLWCAVIEVPYSRRARLAVVDADIIDVFGCRWNRPFGVFSVGHRSQLMC
jgi:hypothetical protein